MATNIGTAFFNVTFNTAAARREVTALVSRMNRSLGLLGGLTVVGATAAVAGLVRTTYEVGAAALAASVDYEQAFAGVRKTVDDGTLSAEKASQIFGKLNQDLRDLALTVPLDLNTEIAKIAELGGQLGIPAEQLTEFTRTIGEVGVTTNVAVEDAATSFARLANIMGLSSDDFRDVGDTLVNLGNKLPATEDEILRFANRIAAAGEIAGFSADEVLAVGAAFASVGVPSERGGTAVQRTWIKITQAVAEGGEALDLIAAISGETSEQFSRHWQEDAAGAWTLFIEGLGRAGTSAFGLFKELNLNDQRLIQSMLSLASAGDLMRTSFGFAEDDLGALATESDIFFNTTQGKLTLLQNTVRDTGISIGDQMSPAFNDIIELTTDWILENDDLVDSVGTSLAGALEGLIPILEQTLELFGGLIAAWSEWVAGFSEAPVIDGTEMPGMAPAQEFQDFLQRGLLFDPHVANLLEILPGQIEGGFGQLTLVEDALRNTLQRVDTDEERIIALANALAELDTRLEPLGENISRAGFEELRDELELTDDQLRNVLRTLQTRPDIEIPREILAEFGLIREQTRVPRGRGRDAEGERLGGAGLAGLEEELGMTEELIALQEEADRAARLEEKAGAFDALTEAASAYGVSIDVVLDNFERLAPAASGVMLSMEEGLGEATVRSDLFEASLRRLQDIIDFRPATEGMFGVGPLTERLQEATRTIEGTGDVVKVHGRDISRNIIANLNTIATFEANLAILFARGFDDLARTLAEAGPEMAHAAEDFVVGATGADSAATEAALESGGVISDELQAALDEALASGDVPPGLLEFVAQLGSDQVQQSVYDEGYDSGSKYGQGFQQGLLRSLGWISGFLGLLPTVPTGGGGGTGAVGITVPRPGSSIPPPPNPGTGSGTVVQNFYTQPVATPQTQSMMQQAAGLLR